ncbi:hypothetical protein AAVH_19568, partial [Aphelenchoides avenae]
TGYILANTDLQAGRINGYISTSTCILTCCCTLVLNLHTFRAYRRLPKQNQRTFREDYYLLIYAFLHLVGQLLMSVYYVTYYSVAPNVPNITFYAQITLMYIIDIMCLGGPVCLFVTR